MKLISTSVLCLATLVAAPRLALAVDYYVDATAGSNANAGTSPANAWRTISFAMGALPASGSQVLHVAAGTYDTALGESWPVLMRPNLVMTGDAGSAATILDASDAAGALLFESSATHIVQYKTTTSLTQGFTIRAGTYGVKLHASAFETSPKLVDLAITGASDAGLLVLRDGGTMGPWVESVTLSDNALGLREDDGLGSESASGGLYLLRCSAVHNLSHGLFFSTHDGSGGALIDSMRCESNGGDGLHAQPVNGPVNIMTVNSSYSGNAGMGLAEEPMPDGSLHVNMTRCTVVSNASSGVKIAGSFGLFADDCILWGNALDLDLVGENVSNSDIGTGVFLPGTNFSADPLFVNAGALDLRLQSGSPCLDIGPGSGVGAVDLAGNPRAVDGNLDTVRKSDLGAYEFQTLHLQGAAAIGTTPKLQLFGPSGSTCLLFLSFAPPVSAKNTKFGLLELDLSDPVHKPFLSVPGVPVAPGPPAELAMPIPDDTALIGFEASFQGITISALAPAGGAFTNRVTFVVQ